MSLMMIMAAAGSGAGFPTTQTRTFTATESFTVPAGVTMLSKIEGKGQDGQPSSYAPDTIQNLVVVDVLGATSGSAVPRTLMTWEDLTGFAFAMVSKVNAGGSGSDPAGYLKYTQYPNGSAIAQNATVTWTDVVAGSANFIGSPWNFDGAVLPGSQGQAKVRYSKRGAFIPATTGLSAFGFGKTFPGGSGGSAQVTGFTSVPVTPLASYQVTVPTGGFVTITYLK